MIAPGPRALPGAALLVAAFVSLGGCSDAPEPEDQPAIEPATEAPMAAEPAGTAPAALVDPNEATEAELTAIDGLDQEAAMLLVEGRPFADMLAVHDVLSARMDSAALDDLYRELFIPIDLNAAPREEILLIPGVGERMAYEFEEYRPYDGIERFRREIGKYVDDDEVARLERYVVVR